METPKRQFIRQRKPRFVWNPKRDIVLFNALLEFRPWEYGTSVYKSIVDSLGYPVSPRQFKLRHEYLVNQFKAQNSKALRKSGTEEEYNMRDTLIQDVVDLEESASAQKVLAEVDDEPNSVHSDIAFEEADVINVLATSSASSPSDDESAIPNDAAKGGGTESGKKFQLKGKAAKVAKNLDEKRKEDNIRKSALSDSITDNTADEPNSHRGKRVNFEKLFDRKNLSDKMKLEKEQEVKTKELEFKSTIEVKRLEMEERVALRKLDLEQEDRERQREFMKFQQERDDEQRKNADLRMMQLFEAFLKK